MAKRESQGLQIALIVFVIVSVLFMVTTVLFWKKAETASAERADFEQRLTTASNNSRVAQQEMGDIKEKLLGYPRETPYDQIEKDFSQLMAAYGAGLKQGEQNLMALPKEMADTLASMTTRLAEAADREAALNKLKEDIKKREEARTAEAEKSLQQKEAEKAAQAAAFQAQRQKTLAAQTQNDQAHRAAMEKLKADNEKQKLAVKTKDKEIRTLELTKDDLISKVEKRRTALSVPDGEIIWVNQRARLVWVNLGLADGVRPQMTFEVFDADENNLDQSNVKGIIEIDRVVDDHSSEARIRSDLLSNPIMAGDLIDSHIWERGQRLHFALAGVMDVDEDGRNDRDLVARLIELNGGVIDALIDDKGNIVNRAGKPGRMTIHTRYLVLGDPPSGADKNMLDAFTAMSTQADTLGVEKISVTRILEFIGYDGKERSVALGKSARAADFKAKPTGGVIRSSNGSVSAIYHQNQPPFRNREALEPPAKE